MTDKKTRHEIVPYDNDKTTARVKAFATKNGYTEAEAWIYLGQYALNRLDTLARYEAKKPKKEKKEKAPKKAKASKKAAA